MRVSAIENYVGNDNTSNSLGYRVAELETSFPAGCNTIMQAVTAKGVTPASNSPSDISTAISNIDTGISFDSLSSNYGTYDFLYSFTHDFQYKSGKSTKFVSIVYSYIDYDNKTIRAGNYASNSTTLTGTGSLSTIDICPEFIKVSYNGIYQFQVKKSVKNCKLYKTHKSPVLSYMSAWAEESNGTYPANCYISFMRGAIREQPTSASGYTSIPIYDSNYAGETTATFTFIGYFA